MRLDSVQIGVSDLAGAARSYELVLGVEGVATAEGTCRFQLYRGAVEIDTREPGLHSLCFIPTVAGENDWPRSRHAFHGLDVRVASQPPVSSSITTMPGGVEAIDHVVINSPDLERAIVLWRDRLGIRLALDREFPKRRLRICFFRTSDITLEFVSSLPPPPDRTGPDSLYGLAYRVGDLPAWRDRLLRAGVEVTNIRQGQKPGTTVATVRSGTADVPTLLISAVP
jgi:catechol 2,3-dioxygenase-like lactoylglutathione lyase family enzyme